MQMVLKRMCNGSTFSPAAAATLLNKKPLKKLLPTTSASPKVLKIQGEWTGEGWEVAVAYSVWKSLAFFLISRSQDWQGLTRAN